jgi:hypothetical protein
MPLQATSGAASYDAFGGGVAAVPQYIEEVFQTWLYTGNGSTQTITNGIDLAGKGGLVWLKKRSATDPHVLQDTVRGTGFYLSSNTTDSQGNTGDTLIGSFNSNGFSLASGQTWVNASAATYASWTFRKQPKFFDVVTWTGNGSFPRTIAHALGGQPGCIIAKKTSSAEDWYVSHRATPNPYVDNLFLNTTAAVSSGVGTFDNVTSTSFETYMNANGETYVAYLFAHNAGGFGLTGTDNVISCGSFTSDSAGGATISLGYEPQFFLYKRTDGTSPWFLLDVMRGFSESTDAWLYPNVSDAENINSGTLIRPTATGVIGAPGTLGVSRSYIYIAIRRGPMKVPTTGTSVFGMHTATSATSPSLVSSFPVDMLFTKNPSSSGYTPFISSRLTSERRMNTGSTAAEATDSTFDFDYQNGALSVDITGYQGWMYRRAPGFFDVVCYTGTGANRTVAHNLTVAPELIITKMRSSIQSWFVFSNITSSNFRRLNLNLADSSADNTGGTSSYNTGWGLWAAPTSTLISVDGSPPVNSSGQTYVSYLFASAPGVSKVGSYTGNGSSQTINCGFTGGARFVMIKRTDSTGDWYVWDTARGIVSGNDPHLSLNTTAAEVTSNDTIDTDSTGFVVNQVSATNVNVSSATYIFLAIA